MFTIFTIIQHGFDFFNHIHIQLILKTFPPKKLQKHIECKTLFSRLTRLSLF
jgi:hypothetical protein